MNGERDNRASRPGPTGDKALVSIADDEFGLGEVVTRLSKTLATMISGDGYTLGIEGPWGSGKSTFVNFIAEELKKIPGQHVLRYEPWLIGDKSMLIASFFSALAIEIDKIEESSEFGSSFTPWQRKRAKRKLSDSIRKYGKSIAALAGPAGGAASLDPSGISGFAAIGLTAVGTLSNFFRNTVPLERLKADIVDGLKELQQRQSGTRFNVIIDDVDRLPPEEAVEILRMVQKVADFPCMTYLICYDSNVLSEQVRRRLKLKDGRGFTEKILQEVVHIPPQEPFALRRSLKAKLRQAFPQEFAKLQEDRDAEYRQHLFFDIWAGEFLATPRDVARLFDAVVLNWPMLPPESDFCDFLWLQLLKLKSHELYLWTREYLQNVGAYRDGGRAGDTQPRLMARSLAKLLEKHGWTRRSYISGINSFLPGVGSFSFDEEEKRKVFDFSPGDLAEFESKRRLGSPSHWRQYFAFEAPSYALRDGDIAAFVKGCTAGKGKATAVLWELLDRQHERRGHFVDMLLDRLLDLREGSLSPAEADGMLSAFAQTMDHFARQAKDFEQFGSSELWRKSARLLRKHKPSRFADTVAKGKSINWLSVIVREQAHAHGLPEGYRSYPERQWLGREELNEAVGRITARYEAMGARKIFDLPDPLEALFCWVELRDKEEVRRYISEATREDSGFLSALEAMRSWQSSSDTGITHPLRDEVIGKFFDVEEAHRRLVSLSDWGRGRNRKQASALLADWRRAKSRAPAAMQDTQQTSIEDADDEEGEAASE